MASKSTYVCLLRGINVSGHKIVKMDQLRAAFETLDFVDVKTYVQSGNVVFKAPTKASGKLAEKIEEKVLHQFGFSVPVLVKTAEEVSRVIKNNSFLKEEDIDASKLHVTFLSQTPEKTSLKMLDAIVVGSDRFHCSAEIVYLYCPGGYGKTKLSNNALEKVLSVKATTRNWNTVNKLHEMMLC
jgi:uncharacterized protein (DUF1697 family)